MKIETTIKQELEKVYREYCNDSNPDNSAIITYLKNTPSLFDFMVNKALDVFQDETYYTHSDEYDETLPSAHDIETAISDAVYSSFHDTICDFEELSDEELKDMGCKRLLVDRVIIEELDSIYEEEPPIHDGAMYLQELLDFMNDSYDEKFSVDKKDWKIEDGELVLRSEDVYGAEDYVLRVLFHLENELTDAELSEKIGL